MNNKKENPSKEYNIDVASIYPQTYIDGTKLKDFSCQNCNTSSCQNCQGNYNLSQQTEMNEQNVPANSPSMQDLLPLLLQSLGSKTDISSLIPLISKFSQNMTQDSASAIQNLLNFLPNKQNKTTTQNALAKEKTNTESKPSNNSKIDNFEIIKDL